MVERAARKMQRGMQVLLKAGDCGESAALVTILELESTALSFQG